MKETFWANDVLHGEVAGSSIIYNEFDVMNPVFKGAHAHVIAFVFLNLQV